MSISRYLNSLYQKWVASVAYGSVEGPENKGMCGTVEVLGKPNERAKVFTAYDWQKELCPGTTAIIERHVKRIIVIRLGDNAFLPSENTIILIGEWLMNSPVETVSQLLVRGGRYIQECESSGKSRMWSIPCKQSGVNCNGPN
jgi:hypothetical protein